MPAAGHSKNHRHHTILVPKDIFFSDPSIIYRFLLLVDIECYQRQVEQHGHPTTVDEEHKEQESLGTHLGQDELLQRTI